MELMKARKLTHDMARMQDASPNMSYNSMPIHVLQCMFHIEKLFCTHIFFHKYEQTRTEKFAHALLLILMREVYRCCLNIVAKYRK